MATQPKKSLPTLPSYDIAGIQTPEEGLNLISGLLVKLREIASAIDYRDAAERLHLQNSIGYVKQFYERVDMLLAQRGE